MFDNDFELNETRAVDILKAIDDIPLIDVDSDDITFSHRAKLIQINESMIMVKIDNNVQTILIDNDYFKDEDDKLSDLVDDNHLIVVYEYSDDYSKMLVEVY